MQTHIFLCEARKLIRLAPKIAQMLQPDEEFGKLFSPEADEPGQANAEGTVLWEIASVAKRSYHESVRTTASHLSRYDPNSAKRSEVNHFVNEKFKELSDFVILDDNFPKTCKTMKNRRIKLSDKFLANGEPSNGTHQLNFFSDINKIQGQNKIEVFTKPQNSQFSATNREIYGFPR